MNSDYINIALADDMLIQHPSYRLLPNRIMWAEFHREFPEEPFSGDGTHLSEFSQYAGGVYNYTLVSGRCPIDPKPDPVTKLWQAQKIGYETA